jgi:hypothetical protein
MLEDTQEVSKTKVSTDPLIYLLLQQRCYAICNTQCSTKLNSVALVRKQTISTERPPLVGEVSTNLLRIVTWSAQRIPTAINLNFVFVFIDLPGLFAVERFGTKR